MSEPIDPALTKSASDELSRAVVELIREEPFFGHLLSGVNRDISARTPTAGVTFINGRPLLSVNPDFFVNTITEHEQRVAVIKHEVLHLLLDHVGRRDRQGLDNRLYNLAADLVINQLIGKWPLPEGAILLETFDLDLPPDQTVDWYYDALLQNEGSFSKKLKPGHSDHDQWGDDGDLDETISRHELARVIRNAKDRSGSSFDSVTGQVRDAVDALIAELEPTVDWRRVLRMFTESSRRTRVANTLRRPSKRYGTYPGLKVKRFHRLAVVLDTSGSVGDELLGVFFAEVRSMWRQGSEVTVIEADTAVQRTWVYDGEHPTSISGRGATRFDPALQWILDSPRPFDGVIYLTDGEAAAPKVQPRCKVLWVLPPGADATALDGERVVHIAA